jgi:hypothetical protein
MRPGDKPTPPRCPLGNIQPVAMDTEEIKRAAWHDQSILVVSIHDARLHWNEAMYLKQIGDRIYGKAKAR